VSASFRLNSQNAHNGTIFHHPASASSARHLFSHEKACPTGCYARRTTSSYHFLLMNRNGLTDVSLCKAVLSKNPEYGMGIKYTEDQKCLIAAAREGELEVVKELISKGLDVDCELKYGSSALMIAASRGHDELVRFMASVGAKVNRRNKFGISPLSEAAERSHHQVLRTLVEFGADVNMLLNNGGTAILAAAVRRDLKTLKVLLELGANAEIENFDGWSARKWVLSQSEPAFLEALGIQKQHHNEVGMKVEGTVVKEDSKETRVMVSPVGQAFWTVFMRAAASGDLQTVRRLVDDGVEINGQSPNGTTALMAAIKNDRADIACELIELGADLSICDQDGLSAIQWAQKKGLTPFLSVLKERDLLGEVGSEAESDSAQVAQ
jgi:ankyrin repeat protein